MKAGSLYRWGFPDFPDFENNLLFFAPYDGNEPFETNLTGLFPSINGHGANVSMSGVIYRPGLPNKYGERTKALEKAEASTNLYENPSFETNTGYTNAIAGGETYTRTSTQSWYGNHCLRVDCNGIVNYQGVEFTGSGSYSTIPVTAGQSYAFSLHVKTTTALPFGSRIGIQWYDSSGVVISGSSKDVLPYNTSWNRYYVVATAPTGAIGARLRIFKIDGAAGYAWHFFVDGVQFENKTFPTPYLDGSFNNMGAIGYSWSGTAHASTSSRLGTTTRYKLFDQYLLYGTIAAWCKIDFTYSGALTLAHFITVGGSGYIALKIVNNQARVTWGTTTVVAGTVPEGTWTHIAATYDGEYLALYVNGVKVGGAFAKPTLTLGSPNYLYISSTPSETEYLNGCLKDLAIWKNRILSPVEIKAIADYGKTVYAKFEDSSTTSRHVLNNREVSAPLTHVFYYDNGAGTYSENLVTAKLPVAIFPPNISMDDAIYFGCDTSTLVGGYFTNIVLEFARSLAQDYNLRWQYYGSGSWRNLRNVSDASTADSLTFYDETQNFANPGSRVISWNTDIASSMTATTINGVTGYWVRAIIANAPYEPDQASVILANVNPYSADSNVVTIDAEDSKGEIESPIQYKIEFPQAQVQTMHLAVGLRSRDRGQIRSFWTCSDTIAVPGVSRTLVHGSASYFGTIDRVIRFAPASVISSYTTVFYYTLSAAYCPNYVGKYRLFLRTSYTNSSDYLGYKVRYRVFYGNKYSPYSKEVRRRTGYLPTYTYLDLIEFDDILVIPPDNQGLQIHIQATTANSGIVIYFQDLILIPCDESYTQFTINPYRRGGQYSSVITSTKYGDLPYILFPDNILLTDNQASIYGSSTETVVDSIPALTLAPKRSANKTQDIYTFAWTSTFGAVADSFSSSPLTMPVIRLSANTTNRYLSLRGDNE